MISEITKASDPCLNRSFSIKVMLLLPLQCWMLCSPFSSSCFFYDPHLFFFFFSQPFPYFFFFVFICWSSNCITLIDLLNWLIHKTAPPGNDLKMLTHIPALMLECCCSTSFHWLGSTVFHLLELFAGLLVTGRAEEDICIYRYIIMHTHDIVCVYICSMHPCVFTQVVCNANHRIFVCAYAANNQRLHFSPRDFFDSFLVGRIWQACWWCVWERLDRSCKLSLPAYFNAGSQLLVKRKSIS